MYEIKDISSTGYELTDEELLLVGGGGCVPGSVVTRAASHDSEKGVCKWDDTCNDAPILGAY